MKAYLKWIVLITWSFTMTSCIKENLPECIPDNTGIVLKFRYPTGTNTQSNKNGVDRLSVFIFDDKGIFVSQINDSLIWIDDNYELELPYKQGSYQFVTWAGYNEATYGITTCIPGQTHIEDFFLFLKRDTDNRVTDQPKLLYHGIHETVALDEHEKMIAWINLKQIQIISVLLLIIWIRTYLITSILKTTMVNMDIHHCSPMTIRFFIYLFI